MRKWEREREHGQKQESLFNRPRPPQNFKSLEHEWYGLYQKTSRETEEIHYVLLLYHRGLLGNTIRWVFRPEPPGLNNRVVEMAFVGMWGKKTTLPGRDRQDLETIGGLQAPVSVRPTLRKEEWVNSRRGNSWRTRSISHKFDVSIMRQTLTGELTQYPHGGWVRKGLSSTPKNKRHPFPLKSSLTEGAAKPSTSPGEKCQQ